VELIALARYSIAEVIAAQRALDSYPADSDFWHTRPGRAHLAVIAAMHLEPTPLEDVV
jgi:hypothetical protein